MTLRSTANTHEQQDATLVPPSTDAKIADWVSCIVTYSKQLMSRLPRKEGSKTHDVLEREREDESFKNDSNNLPMHCWKERNDFLLVLAAAFRKWQPTIEFAGTDIMKHSFMERMG
jgi:hypothetical protein